MLDWELAEQRGIWEHAQTVENAYMVAARTIASMFLYAPLEVSIEESPLSGVVEVVVRDTDTSVEMRATAEERADAHPDILAASVTMAALQCAIPLASAYLARLLREGPEVESKGSAR